MAMVAMVVMAMVAMVVMAMVVAVMAKMQHLIMCHRLYRLRNLSNAAAKPSLVVTVCIIV
jgi:hypothetical protein